MGGLFSDIYKYKQSETKSQLEDFCTEIFVYILRQLMKSKDIISYKILEMFGFNEVKENDLNYFEIITRESHYVKDERVVPDIIIKFHDIINIIEVKVDAPLRKYKKPKTRSIDQIEQYKNITDIKINQVFSLSKYLLTNNSLKTTHKILWSQIYSLLTKSDNEIINNFVLFLEENGMKSFLLKDGVENTIDSIAAILNLIEKTWINIKYPLGKESITREFIGFWVKNRTTAWIGQLAEMKDYLVFEIFDSRLIRKAESIFNEKHNTMEVDKDGYYIFAKIPLKDISSKKTEKKQQEVFQKRFIEEVNRIL